MKNLVLFTFLVLSYPFMSSCSKKLNEEIKEKENPFTVLTVDTMVSLKLISLLPQVQFYISDSLLAIKEGSKKVIVTIDDGTVTERSYYSASDSLIVPRHTEGVVLNYSEDKQKNIIFRVGFEDGASLLDQKFLLFGPDASGNYVLYSKTKKIEGVENKIISYAEEDFVILKGNKSKLLFILKQRVIESEGDKKVLSGKKVRKK